MSEPSGSSNPGAAFVGALKETGVRRALLAVSGGSDSLALLRLAAVNREEADFVAATVDHGLRPEAADEAQWVAGQCAEAGVARVVLKRTGDKPAAGIQEQARLARYQLLIDEAHARGCDALVTAHTADDQAETVFMRLARGSGPRGLAGMAPASLVAAGAGEPLLLLRPFLAISRHRLREELLAASRRWIDDPSNDDPRYERIRIRGLLAALEAQSLLTHEALVATAARMRVAVERQDAADGAAFARHEGVLHGLGFVRLRAAPEIPSSLLARIVRAVGAADHAPPEAEAASALERALATGASTLGGAMLKAKGEALYLFREAAALLGRAGVEPTAPLRIEAGRSVLWDRRFILRNDTGESVTVEPLARDPDSLGRVAALHRCPSEALAAAPNAVSGGRLAMQSLLAERFDGKVMRIP